MGCGCRKNTNNKRARVKKLEKKNIAVRLAAAGKNRQEKTARKELITNKLKFCKICPRSRPTKIERRNKTRVCHESNTSIQAIMNHKNFKCPLGNF